MSQTHISNTLRMSCFCTVNTKNQCGFQEGAAPAPATTSRSYNHPPDQEEHGCARALAVSH